MWFTFGLFWKTTSAFLIPGQLFDCTHACFLCNTDTTNMHMLPLVQLEWIKYKRTNNNKKNSFKCSDYFSLPVSSWSP